MCGSRPWGATAFHLCLFILLLKCVECSLVPASFFPYLSTALHWCRNPGGRRDTLSESPRCWGGSRCWGDRAAGSSGVAVAARSGGAGAKEEQVGRKTRCRAPGSRRGGCRPRGSGGVAPFAWRPKPAAIRHVWGGAGNGGLAAGCPRPEEPPPSARRQRSIGPSTKDVQYHRMAPRVNRSAGWGPSGSVSGNRTEIFFFFFTFNNKINKHKWKAAAPHGRLPHTKHKLKFQAWSSLVFHCCHSSFNPSEAPPWDSRPVSGAGVVHYQLLHRPRSVPTALGPAPLVTASICILFSILVECTFC